VAAAAADFGAAADVLNSTVAHALQVNPTDLRLIGVLREHGPMSAGHLAREASLSPGATTTAIARLVAGGHATRDTDPADRRRALVKLNEKTYNAVESVYASVADAGRDLLQTYAEEQLAVIEGFLRQGQQIQLDAAARVARRRISTGRNPAPGRPGPAGRRVTR